MFLGRTHVSHGDPAMMALNESGEDFSIGLQGVNRRFFVVAHEATIAGDIGTEDGCKFAFQTAAFWW